jgi:hypothetical protein
MTMTRALDISSSVVSMATVCGITRISKRGHLKMTPNGVSGKGGGGEGRMWIEEEPSDIAAMEPPGGVGELPEQHFPVLLHCSDSDTSPGLGLRTMIIADCCCISGGPTTSDDLGCSCSYS